MHTYYYSSFASCESTFFYYTFYNYDLLFGEYSRSPKSGVILDHANRGA
jgi:hypothetical protein